MMEDEFQRIIRTVRRQFHFLRLERRGLRSALDELERLRGGNEIDEPNFQELRDVYSTRLTRIEEQMKQYREIAHDVNKLEEHDTEKGKMQTKILQQIEGLEARIPAKPTGELTAAKEEILPPSVAEAASQEGRLREEILSEIAGAEREVLAKKNSEKK